MSLLSMLDQTCTITTQSATIDDYGGRTMTGGTPTTGVSCSVQADKSTHSLQYMRETGMRLFTVYLHTSASIVARTKIQPTSGPYSGVTLEALAPPYDMAGRGSDGTYKAVHCKEVK